MIEKISAVAANPCRRGLPSTSIRHTPVRPVTKQSFFAAITAAGWLAMIASASAAQSVTLAWNPSANSTVIGYRVYTREENATTATSINVPGLTQLTVPGLKEGLRYTFTVTSYNAAGVESAPSNDAVFVVPVPLQLLPATTPASGKRLQFPAAPGHWYELQASTDLKNWITIWQTAVVTSYAWTGYNDPQSSTLKSRFYRLRVH